MSATSAPFGLRAAYSQDGVAGYPRLYAITGAYGSVIYKGMPTILNTNGTIVQGTAAADWLGMFAGCEYIDATGKPNESNFWPAAQTILSGTVVKAYVYDDPMTIFEIQADGSVAQTAIGDQGDFTNVTAGSSLTGLSQATFASSLAGAGVQAQMRIVGFGLALDNAVADAFTVVQVQNARHQYSANKVAI